MTARGQATRAKLIEATRAVVRETGYAHASTRAIAEAAGVSEGTIYRHFPDKASLFFAAALEPNMAVMAWIATLPDRAGEGTVEETLGEALVQLATLQADVLPLELAIRTDPELGRQRRRAMGAAGGRPPGPPEAIASYLAAEQRLGRIRADVEPHQAAVVLLACLFGLALTPRPDGKAVPSEILAAGARMFVAGVLP